MTPHDACPVRAAVRAAAAHPRSRLLEVALAVQAGGLGSLRSSGIAHPRRVARWLRLLHDVGAIHLVLDERRRPRYRVVDEEVLELVIATARAMRRELGTT